MRASLITVCAVSVAFLVGCGQPLSPTSPTSGSLGSPSTTIAVASPSSTGIPANVAGIAAASEVPFKGRLEGSFAVAFDPPPSPFFSVSFEDVGGSATQLGRFTVEAPHRVNTSTGTAAGSLLFTAANGDRLTADFTGSSGPTETADVFAIVETATVTGGTGRFAGATGSFIVERLVNLATSFTTGSFEGTISSPGAGKP
jgi:hypothetical protein